MTAASSSGGSPELSLFIQLWVDSFAQVLAQMAPAIFARDSAGAASPIVGVVEALPDAPSVVAQDQWILGTGAGRLRGELSWRVPASSIARVAAILTGEVAETTPTIESASPPEPTPEQREAVVELMRQVAGLVAAAAKTQWGEVQLRLDAADDAPSWPASSTVWFRFGTGLGADPGTLTLLELHLSAALSASLRAENVHPQPAAGTNGRAEEPGEGQYTLEKDIGKEGAKDDANDHAKVQLDLLLDVELGVTLRFGSRRLALREILDLNPGAVIELDRQVEEPVDMLLDGRIVARGEVVVMDGNYALRVTEVGPAAGQ